MYICPSVHMSIFAEGVKCMDDSFLKHFYTDCRLIVCIRQEHVFLLQMEILFYCLLAMDNFTLPHTRENRERERE